MKDANKKTEIVRLKNQYKIQVWDLLHKQWSKDTIVINNLVLNNGFTIIKGIVIFTSLSDDEVIANISKLECKQDTSCDICGCDLILNIETQPEVSHFMSAKVEQELADQVDMLYPIGHDMSIDIYPALQSCALLYEDVQHICEDCKKNIKDTDYSSDRSTISNINFVSK